MSALRDNWAQNAQKVYDRLLLPIFFDLWRKLVKYYNYYIWFSSLIEMKFSLYYLCICCFSNGKSGHSKAGSSIKKVYNVNDLRLIRNTVMLRTITTLLLDTP